jgi:hypothetical protein
VTKSCHGSCHPGPSCHGSCHPGPSCHGSCHVRSTFERVRFRVRGTRNDRSNSGASGCVDAHGEALGGVRRVDVCSDRQDQAFRRSRRRRVSQVAPEELLTMAPNAGAAFVWRRLPTRPGPVGFSTTSPLSATWPRCSGSSFRFLVEVQFVARRNLTLDRRPGHRTQISVFP